MCLQYSAEVSQLIERARCLVRDLDPTNHLTFVRIASKKHEVRYSESEDDPREKKFFSSVCTDYLAHF